MELEKLVEIMLAAIDNNRNDDVVLAASVARQAVAHLNDLDTLRKSTSIFESGLAAHLNGK